MRGLADTSLVIVLERIEDLGALPEDLVIAAVTLAELSAGPAAASDERERAVRQVRLQAVESMFEVLPFDAEAARTFGIVSASLRRANRKRAARSYDALIAATALSRGLGVWTCNPKDFEGIDGLTVVAVPNPAT